MKNQIEGQNYTVTNLEMFLLSKLITQQILDEVQQQKQAQNNDNNIAQNYLNKHWKKIVFCENSAVFYRWFSYKWMTNSIVMHSYSSDSDC